MGSNEAIDKKLKGIFLLILFSIVASVFILNNCMSEYKDSKSDSSEYNSGKENYAGAKTCNYICRGYLEADTSRCPYYSCKARKTLENPTPKPKILYKTPNDAIKGAIYFGEKYNDKGNMIYKCPAEYGYHLTTTTRYGDKIEAGIIYDLGGKDISSEVCPNHTKGFCFWAQK